MALCASQQEFEVSYLKKLSSPRRCFSKNDESEVTSPRYHAGKRPPKADLAGMDRELLFFLKEPAQCAGRRRHPGANEGSLSGRDHDDPAVVPLPRLCPFADRQGKLSQGCMNEGQTSYWR
jgi:hypothetical protein